MVPLAAGILGAVLMWAAFPPLDIGALAFVAPAPLASQPVRTADDGYGIEQDVTLAPDTSYYLFLERVEGQHGGRSGDQALNQMRRQLATGRCKDPGVSRWVRRGRGLRRSSQRSQGARRAVVSLDACQRGDLLKQFVEGLQGCSAAAEAAAEEPDESVD